MRISRPIYAALASLAAVQVLTWCVYLPWAAWIVITPLLLSGAGWFCLCAAQVLTWIANLVPPIRFNAPAPHASRHGEVIYRRT